MWFLMVARQIPLEDVSGRKDADTLKSYMPQMLDGYCNHSPKPREVAEEEAKQFLQIISDSSEYQFGFNHSTGYSMNGYRCVEVRTNNPIIFCTAYLNRAMNQDDIINGTALAKTKRVFYNASQIQKVIFQNITMTNP